eukprot:CAMPEP_0118899178 /NCGR_PEP_ID=MMETSP1166-20130328/5849_1 /TAXON_ID=1104430 /ORGANISM="Chrysoreinhardia sp, Strain CCMP3193" /LENGTH=1768 /DNA_ID=CAMNT_0006838303 /DNA_START=93 /DNA_END=5399 /DNA_ORIENTATION=+
MSAGWALNAKVLVADEQEGYALGIVEDVKGIGQRADLRVRLKNERTVVAKGSDVVAVDAAAALEDVEDVARMDALTEASMLECLRCRYARDRIYTSVGGVLLAANPYATLDGAYSSFRMDEAFSRKSKGLLLHPFDVAEAAAAGLCRDAASQSILVSGESGAGKTETCKYVLQYLAYRSRKEDASARTQRRVDELLLRTNPVLEAFANAKTSRNDNSSRFGKYVKIYADPATGRVTTATISSYLLEKVRVARQLPGERNYHAFYQIVKASKRDCRDFDALTGGGQVDVAGVDDKKVWLEDTKPALKDMGVDVDVEEVVEAVLRLRNVDFSVLVMPGEDDASMVRDKDCLINAATALGVDDVAALRDALTTRPVANATARNTVDAARRARDALAKAVYARLFQSLVDAMNRELACGGDGLENNHQAGVVSVAGGNSNNNTKSHHNNEKKKPFIGLLDIFGFEDFGASKNSLEQLLINLANERLQLHFNAQVFANEAREYAREGVAVSATAFVDNASVVEAVETCVVKPLEDESQLKSGADEGLADKFVGAVGKAYPDLTKKKAPIYRVNQNAFGVRHFAGDVAYVVDGFVAKNRDAVPANLGALVAGCSRPSLAALFAPQQQSGPVGGARRGRSNAAKKLGVARGFAASLTALAATLETTTPHFIRCLKPNALKAARHFDGNAVLMQLRYMGVLQIVEARRRGYARRFDHSAFRERYYDAVVDPDATFRTRKRGPRGEDEEEHDLRRLSRYVDNSDDDDDQDDPSTTAATAKEKKKKEEAPPQAVAVSPSAAVAAVVAALPADKESWRRRSARDGVAIGHTKTFLKLEVYEAFEALRDAALRSSALAALRRATTARDLEVALRVAVSDLRIRGPEIDAAKLRLVELRFRGAADDAARALDDASEPGLSVDDLGPRLDQADAAVASVEALVAELPSSSSSSLDENDKRQCASLLRDRADALRRRLVALAACSRGDADAKVLLEAASSTEDDLARLAASLEAALEALSDDVLIAAPPEAKAARARVDEIRRAIASRRDARRKAAEKRDEDRRRDDDEDRRRAAALAEKRDDDDDDVDFDEVKAAAGVRAAEASRRERSRQERDDAEFARQLQRQLDEERAIMPSAPDEERVEEVITQQVVDERADWLSEREKECAARSAGRAVFGSDAQREATLAAGIAVVKFKAGSGVAAKGDWKLLKLQKKQQRKVLVWQPLQKGSASGSSSSSLSKKVIMKRSKGSTGVPLEAVLTVTVGPDAPRPRSSFVDAAHYVASQQFQVPSRWAYLTLTTKDRDYVFGFARRGVGIQRQHDGSTSVVDPFFAELLEWATTIERLADRARGDVRAFGDGCLARAQRTYVSEFTAKPLPDGEEYAPLSRLCPALRPFADVMARTIEGHPRASKVVGAPFGARAPDFLFKRGSWLPAAVLDAPPPTGYVATVVEDASPPFLRGQLVLEPLVDGVPRGGALREHHPVLEDLVAYAAANNFHVHRRPKQGAGSSSSTAAAAAAAAGAGPRTARTTKRREIPLEPTALDLFAACATVDADLAEALVLRGRVRVDARYAGSSSSSGAWRAKVGEDLAFLEPQRGMTALCFVVTWCDVLGEDHADQLVRRLLLLRADASLDDRHPEVAYTPLASAVANGAVAVVRSLLHVGTDPDVLTSDGRTPLHLITLASPAKRLDVLDALVGAGAEVDRRAFGTGDTPIIIAAKEGHIDVVHALVEHAANTLLTNAAGLTPAEAALLELQILQDDDDDLDGHRATKVANIQDCAAFLS